MALKKTKTDNKGYSAEYHRVARYHYDADYQGKIRNEAGEWVDAPDSSGQTTVDVVLYKDQIARDANKEPCDTKAYSFSGGDEPSGRSACYERLKTHPDFAGSEDC